VFKEVNELKQVSLYRMGNILYNCYEVNVK